MKPRHSARKQKTEALQQIQPSFNRSHLNLGRQLLLFGLHLCQPVLSSLQIFFGLLQLRSHRRGFQSNFLDPRVHQRSLIVQFALPAGICVHTISQPMVTTECVTQRLGSIDCLVLACACFNRLPIPSKISAALLTLVPYLFVSCSISTLQCLAVCVYV